MFSQKHTVPEAISRSTDATTMISTSLNPAPASLIESDDGEHHDPQPETYVNYCAIGVIGNIPMEVSVVDGFPLFVSS